MRSAAIKTRIALPSAQRRNEKTSAGSACNVGNLHVRTGFGQAHRILHQFEPVAVFGGENRLGRSEEHTSELQSPCNVVCRLLLEKKMKILSVCSAQAALR